MSEFDWRAYPDRLNLGCGFDRREGYTNVDFQEFHHPDLHADVRDLGMLPSDHYREIIAIVEPPLLAHVLALTDGNQYRAAHLLGLKEGKAATH